MNVEREGNQLFVVTPYVEAAITAFRDIRSRRYMGNKVNMVPVARAGELRALIDTLNGFAPERRTPVRAEQD